VVTRNEAGVLTVPFRTSSGIVPTDYVFGSFITGLRAGCPSFPCAAAERAATAMDAAVPEMFRPVVRQALQGWAAVTTLTAATATWTTRGLRVRARLRSAYGADRPAGARITFRTASGVLCAALTDAGGTATCVGKTRRTPTRYRATFAGTDRWFPTRADGRVPAPKSNKPS
jgi:hypothetical protein